MNFLSGGPAAMPMFTASSVFTVYASLTALLTLIQQFCHQFIPKQVRSYICQKFEELFNKPNNSTTLFTLVIEQFEDGDYDSLNQVFKACEAYLASKLKSASSILKASKINKKDRVSFKLAQDVKYTEFFEEVELHWKFNSDNVPNCTARDPEDRRTNTGGPVNKHFELTFDPDHKDKVFESYIPFILKSYEEMSEKRKDLLLFSLDCGIGKCGVPGGWRSVKFKHPFTFDALAMEPETKTAVIDDLDRFLKRREFYKKVGRAWKRGYLLYGPPGTGKSSLIAAMANYLHFDIYDLQLSSVENDSALRRLLLSTANKSILVIEDVDCSLALADRQVQTTGYGNSGNDHSIDSGSQISLSGLLNFIDGLWSSCGDERIFIFTTNHKEKLDPALLRPGRMDMHIHMSYLKMPGFRMLAANYLNIKGEHHLFGEIEGLLQATDVTPAQVAEELIRNDDADLALAALTRMLQEKKSKPTDQYKENEQWMLQVRRSSALISTRQTNNECYKRRNQSALLTAIIKKYYWNRGRTARSKWV